MPMKRYLLFLVVCSLVAASCAFAQSTHYLDCQNGDDAHDALKPDTAWRTLAQVNSYNFQPGESLLLRRGTVCTGLLWPKGSGSQGKPITLGAYGRGELPRIIGTGQIAGLRLYNQQFWHISDVNITGGDPYGIWISGTAPKLTHFRLTDVVVHDVSGQPKSKDSGLVVIAPEGKADTVFSDIVVDGVTAYNTTQWAGIIINGAGFSSYANLVRGPDVTVRNSVVHDVGGDGILLASVKNGLIERNVSWDTGMQYTESIGTPDGIWEWMCQDCLVQYNEAFFSDSPGVDGGTFDIDFGNINNVLQYNFGHDSQGYCFSIFGAQGPPGYSHNSTIRRNLCINNGRSPREAKRQGAVYLSTWDGGKLDGVKIYGNTIYWDPPLDTAAIINEAEIEPGAPRFFKDNIIVSTVSTLVRSNADLDFDNNVYWTFGRTSPSWNYGGKDFLSLASFQSAIGQEHGGHFLNPRFDALFEPTALPVGCNAKFGGGADLFGRTTSWEDCVPGAVSKSLKTAPPERTVPRLPLLTGGRPYSPKGWTLLALLSPEGQADADASRSQLVVLKSMYQQFSALGLNIDVAPTVKLSADAAANWSSDWNFGPIRLLVNSDPASTRKLLGIPSSIGTVLVAPGGHIVRTWARLTASPEIELTLRALLGTPPGMQVLKFNASPAASAGKNSAASHGPR
jgi:hypothetical protein